MDYLRGLVVVALVALAGAGGGVVVLNLHTGSPRLMMAGIAAVVIGVIGGGLALGRSLEHAAHDQGLRDRFAAAPPAREFPPRAER